MHLYYKISGELSWLGEMIIFHDPSLQRRWKEWTNKHHVAIFMAAGYTFVPINICLN